MHFGQPNVEVSWKMANGQLLFLALGYYVSWLLQTFALLM